MILFLFSCGFCEYVQDVYNDPQEINKHFSLNRRVVLFLVFESSPLISVSMDSGNTFKCVKCPFVIVVLFIRMPRVRKLISTLWIKIDNNDY